MPLAKNISYPSDAIAMLNGFDGTESKDVIHWCRSYSAQFPNRIVVAINQHYPELQSGHYYNKMLVGIVQEAIANLGLSIVIEDNYRREGIVPVEPLASLEYADDYLLVADDLKLRGRLRIWESLGGKGAFYHDKVILELLTSSDIYAELAQRLQDECRARKILFIKAC